MDIGHHRRKWKSPILGVARIVLRDVFLASIFLAYVEPKLFSTVSNIQSHENPDQSPPSVLSSSDLLYPLSIASIKTTACQHCFVCPRVDWMGHYSIWMWQRWRLWGGCRCREKQETEMEMEAVGSRRTDVVVAKVGHGISCHCWVSD